MGGPVSCAFLRTASGCTVAAVTTSAGLLGYHTVLSLSTVKHTAIMTPVPEMPETGVRFFPVTALLCDDLLHSLVRKSTMCFCFSTDRNNHYNHKLYPSASILDCMDK